MEKMELLQKQVNTYKFMIKCLSEEGVSYSHLVKQLTKIELKIVLLSISASL